MAFRFPLQAVFHFRQSVEHQQELRLRAANQQVARMRHLIEQLDHRVAELHVRQSQDLGVGTTSAELRFALYCETSTLEQRRILQSELLRLEKLRDEQQKLFHAARRERETFESLRDRHLREYEREARRRAQRELDDAFLLRRNFLHRG